MEYQDIQNHWNSLAELKDSYKASWGDYFMVKKEIDEISKNITGTEEICDFGCNNGFCTFELINRFNDIQINGIDYSEDLIQVAKENLKKFEKKEQISFSVGNILDLSSYPEKQFDIVLIKRVLINLKSPEDQVLALENIKEILKKDGKIILSEAVEENWENLNRLRTEFDLEKLEQPWHNNYLNKKVISYLYDNFSVELDSDFSSSYYIMSRVIHPWVKKINNKNKLDPLSEINRLASFLPNFGDYGIQRLFVLKLK
ncbi:class I SAM-dependent methyltransferase [Methanoplanus limicola]|uniref:Methyltransferase type 11 n=1 Tax=Methanoplanus limicola DSM 2279 TaxID=937775 RepID=H1Z1X4_9EURY|nr:class I SAM-dependent methyltransferase [Methanoplanus limicola]EHQ35441.1 Methyltransferase type 11 [Methanoplanus limicola DSM 2279]